MAGRLVLCGGGRDGVEEASAALIPTVTSEAAPRDVHHDGDGFVGSRVEKDKDTAMDEGLGVEEAHALGGEQFGDDDHGIAGDLIAIVEGNEANKLGVGVAVRFATFDGGVSLVNGCHDAVHGLFERVAAGSGGGDRSGVSERIGIRIVRGAAHGRLPQMHVAASRADHDREDGGDNGWGARSRRDEIDRTVRADCALVNK